MTAPVFAHLGHILIDAPLFGGPVVMLLLALWMSTRWQKRHRGPASRDSSLRGRDGPAP
ncbi:MAG: hypothetical protein NVSMB25_18200 [Thermoleophilaceae bacterium]